MSVFCAKDTVEQFAVTHRQHLNANAALLAENSKPFSAQRLKDYLNQECTLDNPALRSA